MSARTGLVTGPVLPALVCLGLGAALYLELQRPADPARVPVAALATDAPAAPGAEIQALFDLPPIDAFSEIADRPVFSPNRRPPDYFGEEDDAVFELEPARRQGLDVTVVGIITGPRAVALLQPDSGDRLVPLAEGQTLSGWTLTAIEPFRLVFQRDGDERTIELEFREE